MQLAPQEQLRALEARIVEQAGLHRDNLFNNYYEFVTRSTDPSVLLLKRGFSGLPTAVADEMIEAANSFEREQLESSSIPLRLAEECRVYQQQVRIARAYEGLYLDSMVSADADRLALHTLQRLPGWSKTLRVEIHEPAKLAPGGLRQVDSIGPSDSDSVLVLIKKTAGYVVQGATGLEAGVPESFYSALLRGLSDRDLLALKYSRTAPPAKVKHAVVQHFALSRSEIRGLLKMQAIKPGFRSPMRLSDGRMGYPLGGLMEGGSRLELLATKLYPGKTQAEIRQFLSLVQADSKTLVAALKLCEAQYNEMKVVLEIWASDADTESGSWSARRSSKQAVKERIKTCWRRQSTLVMDEAGDPTGYALDLSGERLLTLPPIEADFEHVVSLRLNLIGQREREDLNGFLARFPNLRSLSVTGGRLTRLPAGIRLPTQLSKLALNNNRIVWSPQLTSQLRSLNNLRTLVLNDNPLGEFDASNLVGLRRLHLNSTGLAQWPSGVLTLPELEILDLQGNELSSIPQAFYQLESVRRRGVRLYDNPLDELTELRISQFNDRPSVRFDLPQERQEGARRGARLVDSWLAPDLTGDELTQKRALWNQVASEPGHEALLLSIGELASSADYQGTYRPQLTQRVWRMLTAAGNSAALRRVLFNCTADLETCADGFTEMFSRLGFEVLVYEAGELEGDAREVAYLLLAKGRSRLGRLNEISKIETARQEIDRAGQIEDARTEAIAGAGDRGLSDPELQALGDGAASAADEHLPRVDEVEIFLAYRVDLAERLALPWQPWSMRYRATSNVTAPMTADAGDAIVAAEQGTRLASLLLEQELWLGYLENTPGFERYSVDIGEQSEALESLREALAVLAKSEGLTLEVKTLQQKVVEQSVRKLDLPKDDVFEGKEMTAQTYDRELGRIQQMRQSTLIRLTQEALGREAGIETTDV